MPPAWHQTLGVRMRMGHVDAVREGSAAAAAGVRLGDIVQEIVLTDGRGEQRRFPVFPRKGQAQQDAKELVDPMQLPQLVRDWAAGRSGLKVTFSVLRDDQVIRAYLGRAR